MRRTIAVVGLSMALLVGGCAGLPLQSDRPAAEADAPASGDASGPTADTGWVYVSASEAVHLQWARTGGTLQGSWQSAHLEDGEVVVDSFPLSGTVDDRVVALNISTLFGGTTLTGSLDDARLTLLVPQDSGQMQELVLQPGSAASYNEAVDLLRSDAEFQQEAAAAAEEAERAARAVEQADQRATEAFLSINRQRQQLDTELAKAGDLVTEAEGRLAAAGDELQTLRQQTESGNDIDVQFALQDVGFALDDVGFAVQDAEWALEGILDAVADLEATASALERASADAGRDVDGADQIQADAAREDVSEYRSAVSALADRLDAIRPQAAELWLQALAVASGRGVSQDRTGYGAG